MARKVYYAPPTYPASSLTFSNQADFMELSKDNADLLHSIIRNREESEEILQKSKTNGLHTQANSNKGLALIIDILELETEQMISDSGAKELIKLLLRFNYEVHPKCEYMREKTIKTKKEIQELVKSFVEECEKQNPSSVIVFIGSDGHFPSSHIITSDLKRVCLFQDVVRKFSRVNCPALIRKPKLFITSLTKAYNFVVLHSEEEFLWRKDEPDELTSLPGFVSRAKMNGGPWFLDILTYEILKDSKEKSLQDFLDLVRDCIIKIGVTRKLTWLFPEWEMKLLFFLYPSKDQIQVQTSHKISFHKSSLIGQGSFGKVYKGMFENRVVAVKVVDVRYFKSAENEVSALKALERHPNVITYHGIERVRDKYHIALELCSSNLVDWLKDPVNKSKLSRLTILNEICKGVKHIHDRGIIHRDIKPDNILVQEESNGEIKILVSDFGLGKKLPEGEQSVFNSKVSLASYAWSAPDFWLTNAVDIFSLGCLFYFVLTNGHPFGDLNDPILIPANIRQGNHHSPLYIPNDTSGIAKLIEDMIHRDFRFRPSVASILKHPMFWDNGMKIKFLSEIKDAMFRPRNRYFVELAEAGRGLVFSGSWQRSLEDSVKSEIGKMGKYYDFYKIKELLRLIRNKYQHFNELEENAKAIFGNKEDYVMYWLRQFPQLLPYTWEKFKTLTNDRDFNHSYFY